MHPWAFLQLYCNVGIGEDEETHPLDPLPPDSKQQQKRGKDWSGSMLFHPNNKLCDSNACFLLFDTLQKFTYPSPTPTNSPTLGHFTHFALDSGTEEDEDNNVQEIPIPSLFHLSCNRKRKGKEKKISGAIFNHAIVWYPSDWWTSYYMNVGRL